MIMYVHFLELQSLIIKIIKKRVPYVFVPYGCRVHFYILFRFFRYTVFNTPYIYKVGQQKKSKFYKFIFSQELKRRCPIRYSDLSHTFEKIF